jgi:hypothetical protein
VQDPRFALTPIILPAARANQSVPPPHSILGRGVGISGALAAGGLLAGFPLFSLCALATVGMIAVAVVAGARTRGDAQLVWPDSIASHEARESYHGLLLALSDVQRALAVAPRLRSSIAPVIERSRAAVLLCGRLAKLSNPLQRYLDAHDPVVIRAELERLRRRAAIAADETTAAIWIHATGARARQLATYEQMLATRDRILARLELVRASLESFSAMIVQLQVAGEEELALAGESVVDHLAGIDDELGALEVALGSDLAA